MMRVFRVDEDWREASWCLETRNWLLSWSWDRPHWPVRRRVAWLRTWSVGFLSVTRL